MARPHAFDHIYRTLVVKECVAHMIAQIENQLEHQEPKVSQEDHPDLEMKSYSQPDRLAVSFKNERAPKEEKSDSGKSFQSKSARSSLRKSRILGKRVKGTSPILKFLEQREQEESEMKHFFFYDRSEEKIQMMEPKKLEEEKKQQEGDLNRRNTRLLNKREEKEQEIEKSKKEEKEGEQKKQSQDERTSRFTFGPQDDRRVIINAFYDDVASRTTSKFGAMRKTKSQPKQMMEQHNLKTPDRRQPNQQRQCLTSVVAVKKRAPTSVSPVGRRLNFRDRAVSKIDTGLKKTPRKK